MDEQNQQSNQSDVLVTPEEINQISEPISELNDNEPSANLVDEEFSPADARAELAKTSEAELAESLPEETPGPKRISPIFWLVGILCFLAVGILIAWLVAK